MFGCAVGYRVWIRVGIVFGFVSGSNLNRIKYFKLKEIIYRLGFFLFSGFYIALHSYEILMMTMRNALRI